MKKNSKKLIISLIIVSLVALGGGIFFACRKSQKTTEKNNSLPPSHSSPKKTLANQIKADLQKDLEKTEKSDKYSLHKSWEKSLGESCSEYRGNE